MIQGYAPPAQQDVDVILADDHTMVRDALARVLEASGNVRVLAQASDGSSVLAALTNTRPDVLILDYTMPGLDTPSVIEQALRTQRGLKILVLTVHENIHYAVRVLESGAHGYVIKAAAVEELVTAIHAVHRGETYVSAQIASRVLGYMRNPRRERIGLQALTTREFDLLRMLASGHGLRVCAEQMRVTTSTASTYRARVLRKLNLSSTADLIRFAIENGVTD
jgi:DNA-binding NarL/FixJ family response regulator